MQALFLTRKGAFFFLIYFQYVSPFQEVSMRFPEIKTESPSGWEVRLPQAAKGRIALVVIRFSSGEDEPAVDSWRRPFMNEFGESPQYVFYEVIMVSDIWDKGLSGTFDRSEQRGVPITNHENVLTYYGESGPYSKMLGMDDPAICHAFLLDREGNVVWSGDGRAATDKIDLMARAARAATQKRAA